MRSLILTLSALSFLTYTADAKNRVITVWNNCDYTVWPAIFKSVGPMPKQKTGWEAKPGSKLGFEVEESWGGRVWGRTGCDFTKDVPDYQMCETGGCNGGLECDPDTGTGVLPVTLAEFNIQTDVDHYDTSNVDGFNIPMAVTNDADCPLSNCPYDLRKSCPDKLQYKNEAGDVVGCLTDCGAEQDNQEYCCFGDHQLPEQCPSSAIPNYPWWKENCPIAYAYAYDESSGTALFTCTKQVNWMITFCPGPELYASTATLPNGTEITQGGDYPDYPAGTAVDGGGAPAAVSNEEGSDSGGSSSGGGGGDSSKSSSAGGGEKETKSGDSGASATGGGAGSSSGGGAATGTKSEGGNASTPSKTGSSAPASTGTGSSSSGSSSSDSASDETIMGLPTTTAYIALGVVAVVLLAVVAFFALRGKSGGGKKHSKKKHHDETCSGSSDEKGGGSSDDDRSTGTDSDSSDDGKKSKSSYKALAKLDRMEKEEEKALRDGLYRDAAKNPTGLTGLGTARLRAFSMGKQDSSDGYSSEESMLSSADDGRRAVTRGNFARKSLAGL